MIIFYLNYFVFIDRLLFRKKLVQFLLANVGLFVLLSLGLDAWREYYIFHILNETAHHPDGPPKMMFILRDGMMMALTAALGVAIRMTQNWYVVEAEKKELEKARTEAELQNLKSQLNPHFLFNTLNNIYSLIAIDPDRAQYAVHDLSRLLRHVLYENSQQSVPLDQELAFMKSYIELMSLRLSGKVELKVELPPEGKGILLPPLLFISLIENAFKHVSRSSNVKGYINIVFEEKAEMISLEVENSKSAMPIEKGKNSGLGLENLKNRLDILYGEKYNLSIQNSEYIYNSKLTILK